MYNRQEGGHLAFKYGKQDSVVFFWYTAVENMNLCTNHIFCLFAERMKYWRKHCIRLTIEDHKTKPMEFIGKALPFSILFHIRNTRAISLLMEDTVGWTMPLSPVHILKSNSQHGGFRTGLWKVIKSWRQSVRYGINALIGRKSRELPFLHTPAAGKSHLSSQQEKSTCQMGRGFLLWTQCTSTLSLYLLGLKMMGNQCLWLKPPQSVADNRGWLQ